MSDLEKMRDRGLLAMRSGLSPSNRQVRLAVDLAYARRNQFPNTITRQQKRAAYRKSNPLPFSSWRDIGGL